jgi:hypothetical protein
MHAIELPQGEKRRAMQSPKPKNTNCFFPLARIEFNLPAGEGVELWLASAKNHCGKLFIPAGSSNIKDDESGNGKFIRVKSSH